MSDTDSKTRWHRLLGKLLEFLLPPVGIQVQIEPQVMSEPPQADIILLRRHTPFWTPEQQARLADGIRDSRASHILIEFKYSESVDHDAIQQTLSYEYFYRKSQQLQVEQIDCFLLSAKTPQAATLNKLCYHQTQSGIYHSDNWLLNKITLLSLNDLPDTEHNAWLRCFASKRTEKQKAVRHIHLEEYSDYRLHWLISGFINLFIRQQGLDPMNVEMTPEELIAFGKFIKEQGLEKNLWSVEERLEGLNAEQRLQGLEPEIVLQNYDVEQRLKGLKLDEIEAYLQKLKAQKTTGNI